MGKHADYLRGTAAELRRVAKESEKNFGEAEEAVTAAEEHHNRQDAREATALAAKFPALERR